MSKTKIEWCDYTINPVKGLCPMACSYCYARRMYKRFKWNPAITYDNTVWHKLSGKPGDKYFVGSTMELFGDWIDPWGMKEIFEGVKSYPERTFIFLTKQPQNLSLWSPFPENCWVGVSATNWIQFSEGLGHLMTTKASLKFLSFEPLLERVEMDMLQKMLFPKVVNWVIIGQQTPVKKTTMPKISWVKEIVEAADKASIPVFLKDNLKPLLLPMLDAPFLRQEFPE